MVSGNLFVFSFLAAVIPESPKMHDRRRLLQVRGMFQGHSWFVAMGHGPSAARNQCSNDVDIDACNEACRLAICPWMRKKGGILLRSPT